MVISSSEVKCGHDEARIDAFGNVRESERLVETSRCPKDFSWQSACPQPGGRAPPWWGREAMIRFEYPRLWLQGTRVAAATYLTYCA